MRFANRFSRRPPSEPRQNHLADPRQADDQRRGLRNVDDTSAAERSAVIDPHDDGAAGALVRDLEAGAERQAAMGCRQRLAVERLAVRRAAAVMSRPVPGGLSALDAATDVSAKG